MPEGSGIGVATKRIDGRLKVTGEARYAADVPFPNLAHAFLVVSDIGLGRIVEIDAREARRVSGLIDIFNHENMAGAVKEPTFFGAGGTAASVIRPLDSAKIWHHGQIVALVVAETLEGAREAACRLIVRTEAETPCAGFDCGGAKVVALSDELEEHEDPAVGQAERALAHAQVVFEARYSTATQHHNPIELFSTTCAWTGGTLTIHEPSQHVYGLRAGVAEQLGMDPKDIHVVSRFIGGAFGSKGSTTARTALVALAAKRLNRPVKLVVTRDQGFSVTTHRAETRHHIRLGAAADGRLEAYAHESWEVTSRPLPSAVQFSWRKTSLPALLHATWPTGRPVSARRKWFTRSRPLASLAEPAWLLRSE